MGKVTSADTKIITVNYGKSLTRMIAAGQFENFDPSINRSHFRVRRQGIRKFEVYEEFDRARRIGRESALAWVQLEASGWKVARIEHLLAYSAQHIRSPKLHIVVAYGQGWDGRYPIVEAEGADRNLNLIDGTIRWKSGIERLLFVREIKFA